MSTTRFKKTIPERLLPKGPSGRNLCRWCQTEVPKGRRTFCGKRECEHEYSIRSNGSYARSCVKRRDKEVCTVCGLKTSKLKRLITHLVNRSHGIPFLKPSFRIANRNAWASSYEEYDRRSTSPPERMRERAQARLKNLQEKYGWAVKDTFCLGIGGKAIVRWSAATHFWEADHIKPVIEGGGEAGLENLRTLCRGCHLKATRELRARLKAKKKDST